MPRIYSLRKQLQCCAFVSTLHTHVGQQYSSQEQSGCGCCLPDATRTGFLRTTYCALCLVEQHPLPNICSEPCR
eukprot:1177127-Prorocentrum_minimum.AAC.6